jgi:hypothetical protein
MSFNNYMGLNEPLLTSWADGRNVTVYPSGKVVDNSTGFLIRRGSCEDSHIEGQKVYSSNAAMNKDNSQLMIFGVIVVAIVALAVIASGKR